MAPMIGFALTPQPPVRGGDAPPPPPPVGDAIALRAFSRDRTLFDGGAAFGRAEAEVPLAGTATPGRGVEARAVTEGGLPVTAWSRIAEGGADGAWSGAIKAPRGPDWMRPQVRLAEAPGVAATGARRFGVGHVIAVWGQSEVHQMLLPNQDNATPEPLLADDMVEIMWHDRERTGAAGVLHKRLTRADPHTAAVGAMANALIAGRPGERFAIVFQVQSGTSFTDLVNDSPGTKRSWADDEAAHRYATADGQHVGMAAASWFAAPSALGAAYEAALFPLFTGRDAAGDPVAIPGEHSYQGGTAQTVRYDHGFGELYDDEHTRWVPYGPHRFEPDEPLRDAKTKADGTRHVKLDNIEKCRRSWRAMAVNPNGTNAKGEAIFLPIAVEPLNYLNGERDPATGLWGDLTHPASDTLDGLGQFGRLTAHACLRSAGLTSWPIPEFDRCAWDPAGAFVEVWSSAGPVTTTRRARGLPPLAKDKSAAQAHWTEAVGFEIDGRPATRAEITPEGRVRVHPREGAFTKDSVLTYGAGAATGALDAQADLTARLWMNVPIVDVGAARVEGVAVRPLPDARLLASTVSAGTGSGGTGSGGGSGGGSGTPAPAAFFTRGSGDAHFIGPALGDGVSGITVEMVVRLREQTASGTQELFEVTSTSIALDVDMRLGKGQVRVTLEDSRGVKLIGGVYSDTGVLPVGRWVTIRLSAMQDIGDGTGFARVTVDGVQAFPPAGDPGAGRFATTTGLFAANRSFEVLRAAEPIDVARVAIWKAARPDGARPATAPYKVIEGGAAAANADAWKAGTTAFA